MIRFLFALLLCAMWAHAALAADGDVARMRAAIVAAHSQSPLEKPAAALDAKGIAITPDQHRLLVNKLLGSERWVITWDDLPSPEDITGNVVTDTGVTFVYCQITGSTGPDPSTDSLIVECSAGDGYVNPTDWQALGEFMIPGSFFLA